MTITLWGRLSSGNVQKVVWALEELELPYEHVPLGGSFGGNQAPEYLALNPNGLVPTLRDGNLTVWESHAIVRYLSAEYGSGLLFPMEARDRAVVDQWTDWTATTFQPAWIGLFWLKVRLRRNRIGQRSTRPLPPRSGASSCWMRGWPRRPIWAATS